MSLVVDIGINADRIRRYSAQRIGDKAHGWNDQNEDQRCKTKIACMKKIFVPNDGNYPTELPK